MSIGSQSTAAEIDEFIQDGEIWMEDYREYGKLPNGNYGYTGVVQPAHWEPFEGEDEYDSGWMALTYAKQGGAPWLIKDLGSVYLVKQHGGEGEGDDYHIVIRIKFLDGVERLFKKPGYHASHDGSYLDGDLYEVAPVERVVVFYE